MQGPDQVSHRLNMSGVALKNVCAQLGMRGVEVTTQGQQLQYSGACMVVVARKRAEAIMASLVEKDVPPARLDVTTRSSSHTVWSVGMIKGGSRVWCAVRASQHVESGDESNMNTQKALRERDTGVERNFWKHKGRLQGEPGEL